MNTRRLWWLYAITSLALLPTIWFYYVGEEAVFPLAAMEMMQHGHWLTKTRFGVNLNQNPMFVWMIIPLAKLLGWQHILEATRILAITSTIATGLLVAKLAHKLTDDAGFAAFSALIFATLADLISYRGWLAYVDPTFGLAIFGAIALLWLALLDRRVFLLVLAVATLTVAFLIKTFTAYAFYGISALVFMANPQYRQFLLGKRSILLHTLALCAPLIWYHYAVSSPAQGGFMLWEITDKLMPHDLGEYLSKLLLFPFETLLRLAPAAMLALYFTWKYRLFAKSWVWTGWWKAALLIALINTLPYWIAPTSAARYLLPIYPVFALVIAWPIWEAGNQAQVVTQRWLIGMIALQLLIVLFAFPYYQHHYRGENYRATAEDILRITNGQLLSTVDVAAPGMSVAAYIDALTFPRPAIKVSQANWNEGFVIALALGNGTGNMVAFDTPPQADDVYKKYQLGGDTLYLLCRGDTCGKHPIQPSHEAQ